MQHSGCFDSFYMAECTHVYRGPHFLAHVPFIECQRQTEQVAGKYPLLTLIHGSVDILKYVCLCHFEFVVLANFHKDHKTFRLLSVTQSTHLKRYPA